MRDKLSRHLDDVALSGCVTLIGRGAEPAFECLGTMGPGDPRPMQPDTIFRIASMSKAITAAAALILVEDCRLRLDDPVNEFLPELANLRVLKNMDGPLDDTEALSRPITLRDLLTFRMGSGMPMGPHKVMERAEELGLALGMPRPAKVPEPDEWIRRFSTLPLMHQPGQRWMYHTGSDVAGVLIRRASGQSFESFLRERLFDPLGMNDTGFYVPPDKQDRFVPNYYTNFASGKRELYDEPATGQWSAPPPFAFGGGGMVSTAADYWAFAQMLMNGGLHGNTRILSNASIRLMTTDQLTPEQKAFGGLGPSFFDDWGWGMGVSVRTRVHELWTDIGTYGWNGGLGTSWFQSPASGVTGMILTPNAFTSPVFPPIVNDFWTCVALATHE